MDLRNGATDALDCSGGAADFAVAHGGDGFSAPACGTETLRGDDAAAGGAPPPLRELGVKLLELGGDAAAGGAPPPLRELGVKLLELGGGHCDAVSTAGSTTRACSDAGCDMVDAEEMLPCPATPPELAAQPPDQQHSSARPDDGACPQAGAPPERQADQEDGWSYLRDALIAVWHVSLYWSQNVEVGEAADSSP
eukprot:TRINITY_DN2009_c0_g2_i1.p1 TRINITY_DN2009_c0_g2~~TRINITY_DN2009_c0_g2_i1.p1  ORF type:complete len:224 (-),score=39.41 TRINITY_DN2009_c0_g2_i1:44-628(-)